ncbi:MAG: ZIP family metal transporter [Vicinamibacterales bacterium]|nr:ZIP family metal transporter [Vicinamibacterales bacterium]HJN42932.1 ZIP family metal transporter [Vicinamibacterales bacterium]
MELLAAVGLSLVGSGSGVLIASPLLLLGQRTRLQLVPGLISYAVGTLLGVALLALVPEALESLEAPVALGALLAGILGFFMLEKLVIWRHCHTEDCEAHDTSAALILIGSGLHNFTDGAIVGAAVLTSLPLGITTALAVAAHQIPQEVGDFAILLDAGYSRTRAFVLNALSASTCVLGAIAVYGAASWTPTALPYVLAVAAGSFLYVAMSDLIPGLHREAIDQGAVRQVILIAAGVGTIMML